MFVTEQEQTKRVTINKDTESISIEIEGYSMDDVIKYFEFRRKSDDYFALLDAEKFNE